MDRGRTALTFVVENWCGTKGPWTSNNSHIIILPESQGDINEDKMSLEKKKTIIKLQIPFLVSNYVSTTSQKSSVDLDHC